MAPSASASSGHDDEGNLLSSFARTGGGVGAGAGAGTDSSLPNHRGKPKALDQIRVAASTEEDTTTARTASTTEHEDEAVVYLDSVTVADEDRGRGAIYFPVAFEENEEETEKHEAQWNPLVPTKSTPAERICVDVSPPVGGDEERSELTFCHERIPKHVEGTHSCESSLTDDESPDHHEETTILDDGEERRLALPDIFATMRGDFPLVSRIRGRKVLEEVLEVQAPAGLLGIAIDTPLECQIPVIWSVKETSVLRGLVMEGDQLVAVDEVDVTEMSATEISVLITSRSSKRARTLTIVRTTEDEDEETRWERDDEDSFSPLNNMNRLLLDAAVALAEEGAGHGDLIVCALSQSMSALGTNIAPDASPVLVSPTRSVTPVRNAEDIVFDRQEMLYLEPSLEDVAGVHFDLLGEYEALDPAEDLNDSTEPLIEIVSIESKSSDAWIFPIGEIKGGARRQLGKMPSVIHVESHNSPFAQDELGNAGLVVTNKKTKKTKKRTTRSRKKRNFAKERVEL